MIVAFNKPYGVLSQFTEDGSPHLPLSKFGFPKEVYPLGRLDADSEGLLLLTDEKELNDQLLNPKNSHPRTYWVQVENIPTPESLLQIERGVTIQDFKTLPAHVKIITPEVPPRIPPIRVRKTIPDTWLELTLTEGKNRQVRRMTAAIGHPTLRLIRVKIGNFHLAPLLSGRWKELNVEERAQILF